jgi:hypothetical protein
MPWCTCLKLAREIHQYLMQKLASWEGLILDLLAYARLNKDYESNYVL